MQTSVHRDTICDTHTTGTSPTTQGGDGEGAHTPAPLPALRLQSLATALNRQLPADLHVAAIDNVAKRPIMYYRPHNQQPTPMLKV